jgi:hypothetical protein
VVSGVRPYSATSAAAILTVFPGNAWFRSITTGNINDPNTWEVSYDGRAPDNFGSSVCAGGRQLDQHHRQSGHTVINAANARLDQVVVCRRPNHCQHGNHLTLNNGPGTALTAGTVDVTGTLSFLPALRNR